MYITIHQWLPLKKETRDKLKVIFNIIPTGTVEVVTDEFGRGSVVKDGFTNTDLQVVTVEKLVDYLGTAAIDETIYDLWNQVVERVEVPIVPPETIISPVASEKSKEMITVDKQLQCDKCPFVTGSARGLKIHSAKHNKIKVA